MIRGNVITFDAQPKCNCCGLRLNRLFDVFDNSRGWVKRCGKCVAGRREGPPRAYTGPYPIPSGTSEVGA